MSVERWVQSTVAQPREDIVMTRKIRILTSAWTALLTLFVILAVRASDPAFVESVRLRYFDTLITSRDTVENSVITVNIDEASLEQLGQWPMPRDQYAKIIQTLYDRNAGIVVFNILMPQSDRFGKDSVLAATMRKNETVILPSAPATTTRNQPRRPGSAVIGSEYSDRIVQYPGLIANVPVLESAAGGVGIVNTLPEVDGVNRRMPLVVAVDGNIYPSLGMEVLRVAAGDNTVQVKLSPVGVERMRIPSFGAIATDNLGRIWIDFSQRSQSYSFADLPQDLGGAVVIVGTTAVGLSNPVPTSRGAVYPHELQAAVIGTMENGVVIQRPDYADGLELLFLLIGGLVLLILTRWTYVGLATVVVLVTGSVVGSWVAYREFLWLFDATAPAVGLGMVAMHAYGVKFVSEFLQKQQIKRQFGSYLSPAMVERLQQNPELLRLGGDTRELSIMFTDVRGFTTISEHYGTDVQGLTKIMNRYMTAMTAKILENSGTLDKYIGDAQMAFWNAPLDDAHHAKNAVRTGLAMMGSLQAFNDEIAQEGVPPFGMGLGINTAAVVVGNMGSDQRFDYTCLGDGVNLASRLEGQSKPYGVKIVLGPVTAEQVKDQYFTLELDTIAVKGKTQGVTIFTVLCALDQIDSQWLDDREVHDTMLHCYRQQQWPMVTKLLSNLKGSFSGAMESYYHMMAERVEELQNAGLDETWDGVYRATSK